MSSKLIDDYLRPFVTSLPSYVQDTRDLLKIVEYIVVPAGAWLVTIDVKASYCSIPHTKGITMIAL